MYEISNAVVVSVQSMVSLNYLEVSPFRNEGLQPSDDSSVFVSVLRMSPL